jgi:uncharacterized protein DUF4440
MRLAYSFQVPLAFSCLIPKLAAAQAPPELEEAMRLRTQAVVQNDAKTWERFTTGDFTVVTPNGQLLNRAQRLAQFKTQQPARRAAPQQVQLKHYDDAYVRRFLGDNGWVLEVWTKDGDQWRVAAVQVTAAAKK